MSKARSFVFTVNNWKSSDVKKLMELEEQINYMIVGEEVGPKNGIPHLQGYVNFKSTRSVAGIVKILPGTIAVAKGTPQQNFIYCSKQKVLLEIGERPKGQGKRSDIENVKEMVKAGADIKDIWDAAGSFQSFKMAQIGIALHSKRRNWVPKVWWLWGESGSGKTRKAAEMFPDAWWSGESLKWWQGYNGQRDIILDDMRTSTTPFHVLLRILDRYPFEVEVKGGSQQLLAENIVITCPAPPDRLFEHEADENIVQLLRRITHIIEIKERSMDHGSEV